MKVRVETCVCHLLAFLSSWDFFPFNSLPVVGMTAVRLLRLSCHFQFIVRQARIVSHGLAGRTYQGLA